MEGFALTFERVARLGHPLDIETKMPDPPRNRASRLLVFGNFQAERQEPVLEFIEQSRVCAGGFPRQGWAVKTDDFNQRFVLRSKP